MIEPRKKHFKLPGIILFAIIVLLTVNSTVFAIASPFQNEFIYNRRTNQLRAQEALVKKSKDIIPAQIDSFITNALAYERTFEERMYLLDHAHALAKMYSVHFGDDSALIQIISIQEMELAKEEAREEKRKKLKSYEGLRGSFPMMEHLAQMEELALPPVIYPHWLHQVFFQCKACHNESFNMTRNSSDITHVKMNEGAQCGACHNGKVSFDASIDGECMRCHMGEIEIDKSSYANIDIQRLQETAERLGAGWNSEALTDGKLPLDKFGNVDWLAFEESKVTTPLKSIPLDNADAVGAKEEEKTHDSLIIFNVKSDAVDNVPFSHRVHTRKLDCASCHPMVFKDALNSNAVSMTKFALGLSCGACHGKTGSLPLLDCNKCHNIPASEIPSGALVRE